MTARERIADIERIEVRAWQDVAAAASPALAARFGIRCEPFAGGIALAVAAAPNTIWNRAWGFGLDRPLEPGELDAMVAWFPRERPFAIQPSPAAEPADLGAQLDAIGLASRFRWVKWMRGATAPEPHEPPLPIEVVGDAGASEYTGLCCEIFDEDHGLEPWIAAVVGRAGWTHYVARDGARAVGLAALYVSGHLAWLGWGGTLASHRRRGIQRALIERRVADALAAGARVLTSDTAEDLPERSNPSYRNIARAGFEVVYRRASHAWFPQGVDATVP